MKILNGMIALSVLTFLFVPNAQAEDPYRYAAHSFLCSNGKALGVVVGWHNQIGQGDHVAAYCDFDDLRSYDRSKSIGDEMNSQILQKCGADSKEWEDCYQKEFKASCIEKKYDWTRTDANSRPRSWEIINYAECFGKANRNLQEAAGVAGVR